MKKKSCLLIAAALLALAASCTKEMEHITPMATGETGEMTLRFSPYDINPMAKSTAISSICSRIDVYIVDTVTHDTMRFHQQRGVDQNFGTITPTLKTTKGYRLLAIAHNYTDTVEHHNGIWEMPSEKVKQTMVARVDFSPADSLTLTVPMTRIVGMFKLKVADTIPANVSQFAFNIDSTAYRWHEDGHGVGKLPRQTIITGLNRGTDGYVTFNIYIIPDDLDTVKYVDIEVQAQDAGGAVIESRAFPSVPIKAGYVSTYTGTFFITFDMDAGFQVGDWGEYGNYNF